MVIKEQYAPHITAVRGIGMMQGLLCADPNLAAMVSREAFARGLMIERSGPHDEVLKCLAPLVTPRAQLVEGLDILEAALAFVAPAARRARDSSKPIAIAGLAGGARRR